MSEAILNALMHLFAVIAQVNRSHQVSDRGRKIVSSYLKRHLSSDLADEYMKLFDNYLDFYNREFQKYTKDSNEADVQFNYNQVKKICNKLKKELHRSERIIVLLRLLEFVNDDDIITPEEDITIKAVTETFNISERELEDIKVFLYDEDENNIRPERLLIIESENTYPQSDELEGATA